VRPAQSEEKCLSFRVQDKEDRRPGRESISDGAEGEEKGLCALFCNRDEE